MTRPLDLPRLRELLEKATPGGWFVASPPPQGERFYVRSAIEDGGAVKAIHRVTPLGVERADAMAIVELHNAAPELLRRAEEWVEMREALTDFVLLGRDAATERVGRALLDRIAKREGGGDHG